MSDPFLFCTDESNDADLVRTLGAVAVALPLFTDCCFVSVDGLLVACERKKIGDMASCVLTGRLLAQLQASAEVATDVFVVLVEGRYRRNPDDGLLEIPVWGINPRTMKRCEMWQPVKPSMMFSRFDQYLTELQRDAGIIIKHTEDVRGTADVILALYQNFQTPADQHQSLKTLYKRPPPTVSFIRPSFRRRVAAELKGVGWERAQAVADRFASVSEMVAATEKDWADIPGIGKKLAKSAMAELRGVPRNQGKRC